MGSIRKCIVAIAATALTSAAGAQAPSAHPNFSGVWVMDTAKSPGPMIPQSMTYSIEQRSDTIKIKREVKNMQGDITSNLVYGADGKPWKNTTMQGGMQVEVSSVLTWEGSTLVITSTLLANGQEIHQVEKWSLDAAGIALTSDRTVEAMGQQYTSKFVFNKR